MTTRSSASTSSDGSDSSYSSDGSFYDEEYEADFVLDLNSGDINELHCQVGLHAFCTSLEIISSSRVSLNSDSSNMLTTNELQELFEGIGETMMSLQVLSLNTPQPREDWDFDYESCYYKIPFVALQSLLELRKDSLEYLKIKYETALFGNPYELEPSFSALTKMTKLHSVSMNNVQFFGEDEEPVNIYPQKELWDTEAALRIFRILQQSRKELKHCDIKIQLGEDMDNNNNKLRIRTPVPSSFHVSLDQIPLSMDFLQTLIGPNSKVRKLDFSLTEMHATELENVARDVLSENLDLKKLILQSKVLCDGKAGDAFYASSLIKVLQALGCSTSENSTLESLEMDFCDNPDDDEVDAETIMETIATLGHLKRLHLNIDSGKQSQTLKCLAPLLQGLVHNSSIEDCTLQILSEMGNQGEEYDFSIDFSIAADLQVFEQNLVEQAHTNPILRKFSVERIEYQHPDDDDDDDSYIFHQSTAYPLQDATVLRLKLNKRTDQRALQELRDDASLWINALITNKGDEQISYHLMITNTSIYFPTSTGRSKRENGVEPEGNPSKKANLALCKQVVYD